MPYKTLKLNYSLNKKRAVFYSLILLLVAVGHFYLLRIPFDLNNELNSTLRSMLTYFCLSGAILIFIRSKTEGGRAQVLYAFIMLMCGLIGVVSLIKSFKTGNATVVEYKYLSTPLLIYGSTYAYIFLLYPIEVLRPGWLTFPRALLLFLPAVVLVGICSMSSLIWLRSLVLIYPILGLLLISRYRRNYEQYCINNYAMLKGINITWLNDYIFGYFVITISYIFVMLCNDPRSGLMHRLIFLFFFLYGFYHVIFQKNPYPEGYFKAGMDESKVESKEVLELGVECTEDENRTCKVIISENESEIRSLFIDKLPEYKEKLDEWMHMEKPYLRKDFKLTDAMEILPLNRSYLSRLFNEGYGETFYQFVMRHRIEESMHLLLTRPDLSITHIADLSGFSSLSVFSRAFTQVVEFSPMQWREKEIQNIRY